MIRKPNATPLFEVGNLHGPACGTPPDIDASHHYVSYFENSYGEQWLFIGERSTGKATIYGGDIEWDTPLHITVDNPCPDMVLDAAEKQWIIACCMAMSAKPLDAVTKAYNHGAERLVQQATATLPKPVPPSL